MSGDVLALVVESEDAAWRVVDSRDGTALAWRPDLEDANAVACYLNSTYPSGAVWPSHDVLVFEVVGLRIAGPGLLLETAVMLGRIGTSCPTHVPTGPGWDHLVAKAQSGRPD